MSGITYFFVLVGVITISTIVFLAIDSLTV